MAGKQPPERVFAHCRRCASEKPKGLSMREWARLEVSYTTDGLFVHCVRHNLPVVNFELPTGDEVTMLAARVQYLVDSWPTPLEDGGITFPDGAMWPKTQN